MKNTIKLSLISAALLSQLNAQEITLEPLEISSTAIKTDELKSTDAVEVYTQEDIEKAHVQNVYEFLNQQTSVTAMPSYGNPFTQLIDMRGYGTSTGNQNIVITVDGRKLNNIDNVPQLLSSISPSAISKIEIIKSSGIVIAGDGANAGVINITTKRTNDKEVSFYIGSYGLVDGSFYVGHKDETISLSATGEAQKTNGIRDINANGDKDQNSFATGSFNLAYNPTKELEFRVGASATKMDVIYAGSLTKSQYQDNVKQEGSFYSKQKYNTNILNAGISYLLNDNISLIIDANHENKKSSFIPSTTSSNYTYDSATASLELDYDFVSIVTGIDTFYGDVESGGDVTTKNNLAAFIMSEFYFGDTTLKAGFRHEVVTYKYDSVNKHLDQKNSLNGAELGLNHMLNKQNSLFLSYSHAYQAPNIDTFFTTDWSNWPTVSKEFNGFIDPMTSDSITLGYNNFQQSNKFKINVYYIDLKNEIYYYKDFINVYPNQLSTNTNIDKSHKYGLDLYDKYVINQNFNIMLNYNYVQAIIDDEKGRAGEDYSGNKLPGVSDHNAKITLGYLPNEHTTINLSHVYRSEAYGANDFENNFSQKQDAFNSTDISATYAKDNWEIFAKINNLFDQENGLWIQDDSIYPINYTRTALAGFKLKY